MRKLLKGIRRPTIKESVIAGAVIFGSSVLMSIIIMFFDKGITSLIKLFVH